MNKKEEKEVEAEVEEIKEEAGDIDIDFGKVFSFFKKKPKKRTSKKQKEESEEEVSIDFKKVFSFFRRNYVFFLVMIPLILAVYVRMYGASMPITDDWAGNTVYNYYKGQISAQIDSQYPQLPQANKEVIINRELNKFLEEQKGLVEQQIAQLSQEFKSNYQYQEGGNTYWYMPDIDPYMMLRYARNIIEKGHIWDVVENGIPMDNHMIAPIGVKSTGGLSFHSYFLVYQYKIMRFFNRSLNLMQSALYFPIIMIALSVIPAFFIGKKLAGNMGGFVAGFIVAVNRAIMSRTGFGHADTDAYNIFFPLMVLWMIVEAFEAKEMKNKILFASLGAAFLSIHAAAWIGWWYVFDFIIASMGVLVIYLLIKNRKSIKSIKDIFHSEKLRELKEALIITLTFFAASGILVSLFAGIKNFFNAFKAPLNFMTIKAAAHTTLWPNVYTTVAELNQASFASIVTNVGGKLFFWAAVIGIIIIFARKSKSDFKIGYAALLSIWFVGTIYASTKGIRFTLLLAPAMAIAVGVAAGAIYYFLVRFISREFEVKEAITKIVFIIIIIVMLMPMVNTAKAISKQDVPIMNDAWWNSLIKIRDSSNEDAIITSWWDFGHHFKYVADRAVTFDGASQNSPMAHWVGKILLADNEKLAVAILRMLNCGSRTATDEIDKQFNDTEKAVDLTYKIIMQSKEDAAETLRENNFSEEHIGIILGKTHCTPPESFFIASEDMVGKAGVWAHFGSWDFNKAKMWVNVRGMNLQRGIEYIQNEFREDSNYSEEEAVKFYYDIQALANDNEANNWIAPWPSYATGYGACQEKDELIVCPNSGLVFNRTDESAILSLQQGQIKPRTLAIIEEGKVRKLEIASGSQLSSTLIKNNQTYYSITSQPGLEASMFTRMYFDQGKGLEHFKLFSREYLITGGSVYVYRVDWGI